MNSLKHIKAGVLDIAYVDTGPADNMPQEAPRVFASAVLELVTPLH